MEANKNKVVRKRKSNIQPKVMAEDGLVPLEKDLEVSEAEMKWEEFHSTYGAYTRKRSTFMKV